MQSAGLHHITAIASDPQVNLDFYTKVMGLRLVKTTVNFDAPDVYHLYYGDQDASAGSIITFFPFPNSASGVVGRGMASRITFGAEQGSLPWWQHHLTQQAVEFRQHQPFGQNTLSLKDPDGLNIDLVELTFNRRSKSINALIGLVGTTLNVAQPHRTIDFLQDVFGYQLADKSDGPWRLSLPDKQTTSFSPGQMLEIVDATQHGKGRSSAGSIHHIAFRARSHEEQELWREKIMSLGFHVTEVLDRQYFKSVYFREPGGVLFEIATDQPGFCVDEPFESLGQTLKLPPWLEAQRSSIEKTLPSLQNLSV